MYGFTLRVSHVQTDVTAYGYGTPMSDVRRGDTVISIGNWRMEVGLGARSLDSRVSSFAFCIIGHCHGHIAMVPFALALPKLLLRFWPGRGHGQGRRSGARCAEDRGTGSADSAANAKSIQNINTRTKQPPTYALAHKYLL